MPAAGTQGNVLLRLVNAGLHMHVPSVVGAKMTLLAEDGNKLPVPAPRASRAKCSWPPARPTTWRFSRRAPASGTYARRHLPGLRPRAEPVDQQPARWRHAGVHQGRRRRHERRRFGRRFRHAFSAGRQDLLLRRRYARCPSPIRPRACWPVARGANGVALTGPSALPHGSTISCSMRTVRSPIRRSGAGTCGGDLHLFWSTERPSTAYTATISSAAARFHADACARARRRTAAMRVNVMSRSSPSAGAWRSRPLRGVLRSRAPTRRQVWSPSIPTVRSWPHAAQPRRSCTSTMVKPTAPSRRDLPAGTPLRAASAIRSTTRRAGSAAAERRDRRLQAGLGPGRSTSSTRSNGVQVVDGLSLDHRGGPHLLDRSEVPGQHYGHAHRLARPRLPAAAGREPGLQLPHGQHAGRGAGLRRHDLVRSRPDIGAAATVACDVGNGVCEAARCQDDAR